MTTQIVHGIIECLKCNRKIELYASTPEIAEAHLKNVTRLLREHWEADCAYSKNPEDYF